MQHIKNILAKLICLMFFVNGLNLFAHTLQTPRGSTVEHEHPSDTGWGGHSAEWWTDYSDDYYSELFEERLERANKAYNCHAYAWAGSRQSQESTWCWIGNDIYPPYQDENIYWTDGSYAEVSSSIATYANYGDYKDHSLELTGNMIEGQYEVRSKWGKLPVYRHKLYSDPYDAGPSDTKLYRRSVDVPDEYSTIQAAINAAVSGQTVHVSTGYYSENITMKSGVDVIGSGITTTVINGTVTFTNTTSDLKEATVNNQITINGGNNNVINNVRAKKRISINGGYHYLQYVTTNQYDYTYGVDIVNSYSLITYYTSTTSHAEPSIYGHDYAGPNICCSTIENKGTAIKVGYCSFFTVSALDFCQNDWDIYAIGSAYDSDAYDSNVFSAEDPEDCIYGDVNLPDPEDWYWCGFRKAISDPYLAQDGNEPCLNLKTIQTDWDSYRQAVTIYNNIHQQLLYDLAAEDAIHTERYEKDFNDAIKLFKQVISDGPQSDQAVKALKYIETCYYELGRPEAVFDYLSSIALDVKFKSLHPHALRLLVSYYLTKEDPAQALELSDRILAKYSNDDLVVEIIYGKGIIYKYYLNDLEKASDIFRQVIAEYPDHPTALSAQAELEDMGADYAPGDTASTTAEDGQLAIHSYPNPFNPSATIRFGLPEAGRVSLVVYDLMGREVVRLIEGYRDAGWQAVVWNGRDAGGREVPTGIYIARLATPQETRAIKLVMMK